MVYRFGAFEFDDAAGELRRNGRLVALEPQPAKILSRLLARAGDVVSRDELRQAVWGSETHVDFDRGLAYGIAQVRAALGDSADNPRFVQTLPRRGYAFIAPLTTPVPPPSAEPLSAPSRFRSAWIASVLVVVGLLVASAWLAERPAAPTLIAVSVFDNETGVADYDRPVAGLADLVVTHLTSLDRRIAVIGNAAILRQPRNIRNLNLVADTLKADYVLLGQLQRGESGLRFVTHVIRLNDLSHLKANRLTVAPDLAGLEGAVVAEFERAVREHVLTHAGN